MSNLANGRRNRSIATLVLMGWFFALFVSIAHGCIASESAHQGAHLLASSDGHADVPDAYAMDTEHDDELCQAACEAQASPMAKEKSMDTSHADRLVLHTFTSAYILTPTHVALIIPALPRNASLLYEHARSLRSTKLTI